MAASTAAPVEEVEKLERQLCNNCREAQLDDSLRQVTITYSYGKPRLLGYGPEEIVTNYSLIDELPKLPKLEVSSRQGCNFCGYLRQAILSRHTIEFTKRHYGIDATQSECPNVEVGIGLSWMLSGVPRGANNLCAKIHFRNSISNRFVIWSDITSATGSEDLANWWPIRAAPTVSPSYPYDIEEMKSRIHQCKKHGHALPSLSYAPERLLDVREDHPRLICGCEQLPEARGQTPRYAALSYCWGTSEEAAHQLKTTCQSMPERQRGIQYNEMPPVLRDAICVTRSLGIPFLWVDALCIIQGDNSDWEKQCAQMDKIYGHAEVTLVASSSNSCRDSFLHPETPITLFPFSSNLKVRRRSSGLLKVTFSGCTKQASAEKPYSDMNDSLLATRGWAVQERILSTRMIIFGRSNVHFVCPSDPSREDYSDRDYLISRFRGTDNESSHVYWTKLLDEYRCITVDSFTRPTDLLPALSGLAAYFGSRIKDQYCAGHWHKELYRSLMWRSAKPSGNSEKIMPACSRSPYIVPSWSRLGKGFSYALDQKHFIISDPKQETLKLEAHISPTASGENPFGAIQAAQLEVRTHTMSLRPATNIEILVVVPDFEDPYLSTTWHMRILQRDKSVLSRLLERDKHELSCCVWVDYHLSLDDFRRDAEEWKWVLLGVSKERPFGLLLSSVNDTEWYRVGVFAPSTSADCMRLRDFTKFSSVETVMIL